jgi:uncharacterized membrane protein YccF (DUF307 family)
VRTIGNILWLVLAGVWLAIAYVVAGLLALLPIITIPFALQSFKIAGYALWPFGRVVVRHPERDVSLSPLANVIWFILGGWWLVLAHLVAGVLLMVTIVGIPFGVANVKLAALAVAPFGKRIVTLQEAARSGAPILVRVQQLEDG